VERGVAGTAAMVAVVALVVAKGRAAREEVVEGAAEAGVAWEARVVAWVEAVGAGATAAELVGEETGVVGSVVAVMEEAVRG
jgi:hypothetical protein